MEFLPFSEIKDYAGKVLAVDCHHPKAYPLSHWKGVVQPEHLKDDTSAGIVLNAIKQRIPELDFPYASNNHFDIDGFLGVWSLLNPELAIRHEALIRQMAQIGDFREYDPSLPESERAIQLVCWINSVEKIKFYAPFGESQEAKSCVEKYAFFLQHFESVLLNPSYYRKDWEQEFERVKGDYLTIKNLGHRIYDTSLRMVIVTCPQPVHYYALYAHSEQADMVLSIYPQNRYELEYKYSTWVTTSLRQSYPRIDLAPLVAILNALETTGHEWTAESYKDTAPILRIKNQKLTKEQRYNHPHAREIVGSSISEGIFLDTVSDYFQKAYIGLMPQQGGHSWAETKSIYANRI